MSNPFVNTIVSVILAVFASNGFWMFIQSKSNDRSAEAETLRGLAHDRICHLGGEYVQRGYITPAEYENLDYLFKPYKRLGGNGSAERIMKEVEKLPLREE
jgi:hypothetical protein